MTLGQSVPVPRRRVPPPPKRAVCETEAATRRPEQLGRSEGWLCPTSVPPGVPSRHYHYCHLLPSTTTQQRQDIVYHLTKRDNGSAPGVGGGRAGAGHALGHSLTLPTSGRGLQLQPVSSEPSLPLACDLADAHTAPAAGWSRSPRRRSKAAFYRRPRSRPNPQASASPLPLWRIPSLQAKRATGEPRPCVQLARGRNREGAREGPCGTAGYPEDRVPRLDPRGTFRELRAQRPGHLLRAIRSPPKEGHQFRREAQHGSDTSFLCRPLLLRAPAHGTTPLQPPSENGAAPPAPQGAEPMGVAAPRLRPSSWVMGHRACACAL